MLSWLLIIFLNSLAVILLVIFLKKRKTKKENKEPINQMELNNKEMSRQPSIILESSTQSTHSSVILHKQLKDITILDRLGGGNVS